MQNVENSFSGSNEQYAEIVRLKETLFEQVQEKDSLMKTVSDLKNNLKMEENRNIDREIALEKKIKQLDNIIFKRGQSAQTVHMMTKSKICYDHSTKQAIGFEKPFYLKKVQESKPKLYDGNVILKMDTVVILDSDETLMLCEESRSKMLLKEQDPLVVKHRVNTKPINYAILNNDYNKRFVRQSDLYSEHAYWKATSVPALDPSHSLTTIKVEVPKELPKMIQVRLKETVRRIRTDNGTEFVNQTLREYYEKVGISHETSVARSPQQNGVVERRNRTLIEAARTMLIYAKAPLFLWAEAVATACYTQNRSMIRRRHGKTPYELLHDKPPDLSYLHMFGALCYPTNDSENLGKLQPKADIGIFIGYAPTNYGDDDDGGGERVAVAVVARDLRPWSRWCLWVGMRMIVDMGCFGVGDGYGAWPESWLNKKEAPD
ncbi:retrovirus-related pol polyprotein from transposon TNT 1-94 [Tanacetum coccineum]